MRPVSQDEQEQLEHIIHAARTGTLAVMTVRNRITDMDEALLVCADGLDITPLAILKFPRDLCRMYDPGPDVIDLAEVEHERSTGASTSQA